MGILTDSSNSPRKLKLRKFLIDFKWLVSGALYVAGIVYFCLLAHFTRNNATYFSENALLPGLVYSEMRTENTNYALKLNDELDRERKTHKNSMPTAWILAKFRQIGLETHTHNFTLNYPLGGGRVFSGKNVYGILRAPRIGSTESIVISTPYRTPDSLHSIVQPSVAILMAFAHFARRQKYWAKDIIFLVTDQEQLGMQAWLEAYHDSDTCSSNHVLHCGSLEARAGSIQAAINLELQSFDTDFIDVKIEGLNGQLPNLDLVNLIQRLALKEGIVSGHKQTTTQRRSGVKSSWEQNFRHMLSMVLTQSTGVPNGNHGLFYRYGIEAVTLEGYRREQTNHQRKSHGANALLKLVEGIARSLNNLLERFHQSFFFYLLVASDRFVSIGDYMPSLSLMVSALLIKAFITWLSVNRRSSLVIMINEQQDQADDEPVADATENKTAALVEIDQLNENFEFISVGRFFIIAHALGVLAANLPFLTPLDTIFYEYGIKTEVYLFFTLCVLSAVSMTLPLFFSMSATNVELLHIAALLEMSTVLIVVGMLNFSLALFLSTILVPFALLVTPVSGRIRSRLTHFICFAYNPTMMVFIIVFLLTWWSFSELSMFAIAQRAVQASMDSLTFAIVDSIIYGNWLYPLITLVFFPIWITFFSVLCIGEMPKLTTTSPPSSKMTKEKLN